jgi:hypothetical protein
VTTAKDSGLPLLRREVAGSMALELDVTAGSGGGREPKMYWYLRFSPLCCVWLEFEVAADLMKIVLSHPRTRCLADSDRTALICSARKRRGQGEPGEDGTTTSVWVDAGRDRLVRGPGALRPAGAEHRRRSHLGRLLCAQVLLIQGRLDGCGPTSSLHAAKAMASLLADGDARREELIAAWEREKHNRYLRLLFTNPA